MTRRFGIDTSILVRLITRHPESDFDRCVRGLRVVIEDDGEVLASNQVIGETCVAVQHHYGVSSADARTALLDVLGSGLVAPTERALGPSRRSRRPADRACSTASLRTATGVKTWRC